jgi:hypothetical protein
MIADLLYLHACGAACAGLLGIALTSVADLDARTGCAARGADDADRAGDDVPRGCRGAGVARCVAVGGQSDVRKPCIVIARIGDKASFADFLWRGGCRRQCARGAQDNAHDAAAAEVEPDGCADFVCPQAATVASEVGLDLAQYNGLISEVRKCFGKFDSPSGQFENINATYKAMGGPAVSVHASPEVERHIVVYARTPQDVEEERDAADIESGHLAEARINTCPSAAAFYPVSFQPPETFYECVELCSLFI